MLARTLNIAIPGLLAMLIVAVMPGMLLAQGDSRASDVAAGETLEEAQQDVGTLRRDVNAELKPTRRELTETHEAVVREGDRASHAGPLEWKTDLALWTGVVFLVLLVVLWKFAWGPIANGLQRREQGIAMQISEAEQANQNAQRLLAEHQNKLDAAADEVRRILEQGRREAEQSARQIVETARDDAKNQERKALAEIDQATAAALSELAEKSARLATQLAGRIVKNELRPGDHAELVKQAVADFTKSSRN